MPLWDFILQKWTQWTTMSKKKIHFSYLIKQHRIQSIRSLRSCCPKQTKTHIWNRSIITTSLQGFREHSFLWILLSVPQQHETCVYCIHSFIHSFKRWKASSVHLKAFCWKPIRLDVPAGKWPSLTERECCDRSLAKLTNVKFRQPINGWTLECFFQ